MPIKDPEARRAYGRAYRAANRDRLVESINAWKRNKYATDSDYRERAKADAAKVPAHVHAARMRVYKALRSGEITRPNRCENCSAEKFTEAAHVSYADRLNIRWLCRTCHRKFDKERPKVANSEAYVSPPRASRISDSQAIEIRRACAAGRTQLSVAKDYGVSRQLIGLIVRGGPL